MKKVVIAVGVVAMLGACGGTSTSPTTAPKPKPKSVASPALDVDAFVDMFLAQAPPSTLDEFCTALSVFGYDVGLKQFASGYDSGYEPGIGMPTSSEAFAELASRCVTY